MRAPPRLGLTLALCLCPLARVAAAQVKFTDVTVRAGLLPADGLGSDLPGMRPGAAVGDFDNDGWQDLFVLGGQQRPDALYMNNGDGTFTNRAGQWGVRNFHRGGGACVGDYDGDGWLDIYVTSDGSGSSPKVGKNILWHNNGNGTFSNRAKVAGVAVTNPTRAAGFGCSFGDYDLDGDLDLITASWYTLFAKSNDGNRLFRNNGDGTFTDASYLADLRMARLHGFTPSFVDMDGDRYPDLLFVADFHSSQYFINNQDGTFTDWTKQAGVNQEQNGMGSTTGDFDNDGLIDWYVTNILGNRLYINQGSHSYQEVGATAGVDQGEWGWGAVAVDLDLDGWLDIVETNGWTPPFDGKPAKVWLNNGDLTFTEVGSTSGLNHALNGLGMVNLDYDNDGDQDILITSVSYAQLRLYRNDQSTAHHWLRISLDTSGSPGLAPNGFGSRVEVSAGASRQVRILGGDCHYLSTSELVLGFGLDGATQADGVVVRWNDGTVTIQRDVAADRHIVIKSY